jgi:hypothetical protein
MMSDLNFNPIPSEIKYFIPGKETVNDIPNLFGSLQKIDLEVVNSYTYLNCYQQTEVCHCLMSMSCH